MDWNKSDYFVKKKERKKRKVCVYLYLSVLDIGDSDFIYL